MLDNEQKKWFFDILAEPEKAGAMSVGQLERLVKTYPQVSILRAMLARAGKDSYASDFEQKLRSASVYIADRSVLFKIVNSPDRLLAVENSQLYSGGPDIVEKEEVETTPASEPIPAPKPGYAEDDDTRAPWDVVEEEELAPATEGEDIKAPGEVIEEETPGPGLAEDDEDDDLRAPWEMPEDEGITPAEIEANAPGVETLLDEEPVELPVHEDEALIPEDHLLPEETETTVAEHIEEPTGQEATEEETIEETIDQQADVTEPENDDVFDEEKYLAVMAMEMQLPELNYASDAALRDDEIVYPAFDESYATPVEQKTEAAEIDDEVFDEITGIDEIAFNSSPFKLIVEDGVIPRDAEDTLHEDDDEDTGLVLHESVIEDDDEQKYDVTASYRPQYNKAGPGPEQETEPEKDEVYDAEERLILGNIAGADYFAFDNKFPAEQPNHLTVEEEKVTESAPVAAQAENNFIDDDGRVSKYHDDKMPYSFMWWLDKTRREHATLYQPYAPYKQVNQKMIQQAANEVPAELQKQYYENIFHVTTIENLDKAKAEFNNGNHQDEIIERFIKEEPQIKPPSNDKLDNENKAKKSAEDQDELVSETLARIYLDQMLYHKAINTYKKLLLKFPEKSSYFVAQIELLERKIN